MVNIHPASMLGLMFLLHFFAAFNLQLGSGMDKFKQKKWWTDQIGKDDAERMKKYGKDYEAAMWCHGMYWSLVVCLPLLMTGGIAYAVNALIHGFIHALIDHAKANRFSLNLIQDQLLHGMQILCIWMVWTWFLCILST